MANLPLPKRITGTVYTKTFFSPTLGIEKKYNIYLPPSYNDSQKKYPVLYLFRGHEKEWFDPYQDHSRGGTAIQHLADELINDGVMGEMIIVGPSMMSDDGQVYGLGINFLDAERVAEHSGIGSGQFEDYFIDDVVPHIEKTYRAMPETRAADGFSLGGYTSVMLAIKHPALFKSVGSYDGSHMFRDFNDPRQTAGKHDDDLWVRNDEMFSPAFQVSGEAVYNLSHLRTYNPLNLLESYTETQKNALKKIHFHITTAAFDGYQGNRDRSVHLITLFQLYDIENRAAALVLSSDAHHTWKFCDLHARETLPKHAVALNAPLLHSESPESDDFLPFAEIINATPTPGKTPIEMKFRVYARIPAKINIVNLNGEVVKTLKNEIFECGHHAITWKGQNTAGQWVPSGTYFMELISPNGAIRQKFVFLRW